MRGDRWRSVRGSAVGLYLLLGCSEPEPAAPEPPPSCAQRCGETGHACLGACTEGDGCAEGCLDAASRCAAGCDTLTDPADVLWASARAPDVEALRGALRAAATGLGQCRGVFGERTAAELQVRASGEVAGARIHWQEAGFKVSEAMEEQARVCGVAALAATAMPGAAADYRLVVALRVSATQAVGQLTGADGSEAPSGGTYNVMKMETDPKHSDTQALEAARRKNRQQLARERASAAANRRKIEREERARRAREAAADRERRDWHRTRQRELREYDRRNAAGRRGVRIDPRL